MQCCKPQKLALGSNNRVRRKPCKMDVQMNKINDGFGKFYDGITGVMVGTLIAIIVLLIIAGFFNACTTPIIVQTKLFHCSQETNNNDGTTTFGKCIEHNANTEDSSVKLEPNIDVANPELEKEKTSYNITTINNGGAKIWLVEKRKEQNVKPVVASE